MYTCTYEKFIQEIPEETIYFIRTAMKINSYMEKNRMNFFGRNIDKNIPKNIVLTTKQRVFLSFLIASTFFCNEKVSDIFFDFFRENELETLQQLLIIKDEMPHTLTEEENKKIFEERFLPCINELIRTNQDIYEKYNTNIAYQDITPQFILYAIVRDKFDSKQNQNKTSNSIGSSKFVYDLCEGDIFLVNVLDYLRISMEDTIKHSNLKKNPNNNISSIENSFDDDYHLKKQSRKKKTTNPEIINNLKAYGDFLTDKTYKFNPAVGREKELKALMLAVATPKKSAVITGKAGVGKTALVEGLAYLIQTKQAPKLFEKKEIMQISANDMISGTKYRGDFEERMKDLLNNLKEAPDVILFIDEIHTIIGAGTSSEDRTNDMSNILKPALGSGEITLIGATTKEEYESYFIKRSALSRRFKQVEVNEPDEKTLKEILIQTMSALEYEFSETNGIDIKFAFLGAAKEKLVEFIIKVTDDKNRQQKDKQNNPDLAITLLASSIAYAAIEDSDEVTAIHVAEAIRDEEKLIRSSRERLANELEEKFTDIKKEESTFQKVLTFPTK